MDGTADRLDQAADALAALARDVPALAVAPGAFAALPAEAPGLPARVGRALHDHWNSVVAARSHEASAVGERLAEMARSVRVTRRQYADTDDTVESRFAQLRQPGDQAVERGFAQPGRQHDNAGPGEVADRRFAQGS